MKVKVISGVVKHNGVDYPLGETFEVDEETGKLLLEAHAVEEVKEETPATPAQPSTPETPAPGEEEKKDTEEGEKEDTASEPQA